MSMSTHVCQMITQSIDILENEYDDFGINSELGLRIRFQSTLQLWYANSVYFCF